jgi:NTE family protein
MTRTALVLGGGGVTGVAWELGILKGLAEAGVDLSIADLAERMGAATDREPPMLIEVPIEPFGPEG